MNLFTTISIFLSISCFILSLGTFVFSRNKTQRIWALFNADVGLWGLGLFFVSISKSAEAALWSWKFAHVAVLFIPILFYHVAFHFCNLKNKNFLIFSYAQGLFFALSVLFSNQIINSTRMLFNSIFYYVGNLNYAFMLLIWSVVVLKAFMSFYKAESGLSGIKKRQGKYLIYGSMLGFWGGCMTILPAYGLLIYPIWHGATVIYALIATYAIFRYQLLDIKIVLSRLAVFIPVYAIVLGIPFLLGYKYNYWKLSLWAMLLFATIGPFIYLYFQRKTEKALLQEERRIQDLLSRASIGMRTIRSLPKLLELIVDILAKSLRLDNAAIYLHDSENNYYVLKVSRRDNVNCMKIESRDPLIRRLDETRFPIVCEEVKLLFESHNKDENLQEIVRQMTELQASVIVPAIIENILLGFIILGERNDSRTYSTDLINVLSVLGNQAALAIENCRYILRVQEEGLAERMTSLDHMASSMAHEIDNPMHIIRTSLSFVKDFLLKDVRVSFLPAEIKNDFEEAIQRSLQAGDRVSGMIKAILDYSQMGTGKLESIRINEALEGFLLLIQPQIKTEKVQLTTEIEKDLPLVLGDRVQMEEIFMNFVRNSLHAVKRNEEKKIVLRIFKKNENTIRVECTDNGYGIPKEIINDIFLSSMTTKGSSEGTGLGLYRVRKIVDLFRGKVWAESEGKGKGATLIVELPIYEGPKNNMNGREKS